MHKNPITAGETRVFCFSRLIAGAANASINLFSNHDPLHNPHMPKCSYITIALASALAAWALAVRNPVFLGSVVIVFFVVLALGVALPRLHFFAPFICRANTGKKLVALTFDDGPDPRSTPQLLALLRERKTPAAFFCIGSKVAANPALAAQISKEGHLVENHAYTHSYFSNFHLTARLRRELERTQAVIEKTTGRAPRFFRPFMGLSNSCTWRAAQDTGLRLVAWSIRSLDTVIARPEKITRRVMRRLHPGAIILLHDGNIPPEKLVATTALLLDALRARNYEVTRLDSLVDESPPNKP